ncbi:MAG TPA: hypothetical protein VJM09_11870, partial [Sphingobium sp.]|nr:hypothetical protein [Sphingobium sp.]
MWQTKVGAAALCGALRKQYTLCNLQPGETVALLSDAASDRQLVDAAFEVASEMGAVAYELRVHSG